MASWRAERGFTLTELMVVVAIVGVLAALGIAAVRGHVIASRAGEAAAMVQAIRVAQERYRAETGVYLDVKTVPGDKNHEWHPRGTPDSARAGWHPAPGAELSGLPALWQLLNVNAPGQGVRFVYAVRAGPPGVAIGDRVGLVTPGAAESFPTGVLANQNWYVIEAWGDTDGDGRPIYFAASSFTDAVFSSGVD